jgi:hypothetical protein
VPKEIHIYFEGSRLLKPGFDKFFVLLHERAQANRCKLRLIAGEGHAPQDFKDAIEGHPECWNVLLIDSERPHSLDLAGLLCRRIGLNQDYVVSIFWMVEMMESWFYADKDALARFYGRDFRRSALSANLNVERISKSDLRNGLHNATKDTLKGSYYDNKAVHGSQVLALIDSGLVRKAAPNCARLFDAILARLS